MRRRHASLNCTADIVAVVVVTNVKTPVPPLGSGTRDPKYSCVLVLWRTTTDVLMAVPDPYAPVVPLIAPLRLAMVSARLPPIVTSLARDADARNV